MARAHQLYIGGKTFYCITRTLKWREKVNILNYIHGPHFIGPY